MNSTKFWAFISFIISQDLLQALIGYPVNVLGLVMFFMSSHSLVQLPLLITLEMKS